MARSREIAAWLRGQVDFHRVERTRAVFNALAVFDEGASLPTLVEALGAEEVALRDSALVALRRISGLSLPADAGRWSTFFRDESAWFDTQRPRQAAIIAEGRPVEVGQAVRSLVDHRLFRSQIASDLLPLLANSNPEMRLLAVDALKQLGSRQAVPQLIDALEDADARVRNAAHAALQAIVGGDASTEPALARARLLGDP
jgi:HEAT repeat protein